MTPDLVAFIVEMPDDDTTTIRRLQWSRDAAHRPRFMDLAVRGDTLFALSEIAVHLYELPVNPRVP